MKHKSYLSRATKIKYLSFLVDSGVEAFVKEYPKIAAANCHVEALADFAMSQWVIAEEPVCSCCGSTENLQNGHLFTREWRAIRWERDNCGTQCAGCNLRHEHNPEHYRRVMVKRHGEARVEEVYIAGVAGSDFSKKDKLGIALNRWLEYLAVKNSLTIIGRKS